MSIATHTPLSTCDTASALRRAELECRVEVGPGHGAAGRRGGGTDWAREASGSRNPDCGSMELLSQGTPAMGNGQSKVQLLTGLRIRMSFPKVRGGFNVGQISAQATGKMAFPGPDGGGQPGSPGLPAQRPSSRPHWWRSQSETSRQKEPFISELNWPLPISKQ